MRCTTNRVVTMLLLVLAASVQVALPASADAADAGETANWSGTWQGHDMSVVVVARGHEIGEETQQTLPWWRWGNTTTDAYLFSWSDDGLVDLVLDFSTADGRTDARIYVPVLQEQRLAIQVDQGSYTLPENLLPLLMIWPTEGEWLADGLANFNLAGTEFHPDTGLPHWALEVGSSVPGAPEWVVRKIANDPDPGAGYPRFEAAVRKDDSITYPLAEPLMPSWPFLSAIDTSGHYGEIHPLRFDTDGRVLFQNWAGFHIAGMYQINSISLPPYTNFESPFAFYQFDPDAGLYPNMVIRSDIWPQHSSFGPPPYSEHRTAIRMSWTDEQPNLWKYSISVIGNHYHDDWVTIGNTDIKAISYEAYPQWITSKEWKAVTFVEAVHGEAGSEGIYEYTVEDNYTVSEWVNGLRTTAPSTVPGDSGELSGYPEGIANVDVDSPFRSYPLYHPQRLLPGFRGEYSFVYQRVPALYLSGIDGRVHLLHAEGGGWKLDDTRVLRVENMDGDEYIDTWIRERVPIERDTGDGEPVLLDPVVEESLQVLGDHVLYTREGYAELYELNTPASVTMLDVPVDATSWQQFLHPVHDIIRPSHEDLHSWLGRMDLVPIATFEGTVSQVRPDGDAMRFVYTTASGSQVVTVGSELSVESATPHSVSASMSVSPLTVREHGTVSVFLEHDGNVDLQGVSLDVVATSPEGDRSIIGSQDISMLAGEHRKFDYFWAPPWPGTWSIEAIMQEGVTSTSLSRVDLVDVAFAPGLSNTVPTTGITTRPFLISALTVLFLGAIGAGIAGWRLWAHSATRSHDAPA